MRTRGIKILLCALLLNCFTAVNSQGAAGSGTGGLGGAGTESITNPVIGSASGSLTEPVSTYDPTAFTVPRMDTASGNMIITGNVGGGRHFRDTVPYSSVTDIQANLESTSLDSFLRYSSTPSVPFYSPTGSLVSVRELGAAGTYRAASQKIRGYSGAEDYFVPYSSLTATQPVTSSAASRYVTMPATDYGYSQSLLGHVRGYADAGQFLRSGKSASALRSEQVPGREQISLLKSSLESTLAPVRAKPFEIAEPSEQKEPGEKAEAGEQIDVYEQMKKQLGISEEPAKEQVSRTEADERIRKTVEEEFKAKLEIGQIDTEKSSERRKERREEMEQAGGGGTTGTAAQEAKTTERKRYKTFASESGDEFNHYMEAAEQYVKEGKFYQASDAYSLASIYKPMDPLSYAGKSHALFGAGEYLSSARLLAFALKIFPAYADVKVDLVEIFGNKELIDLRTAELAKWASESKSAELHLLLAYICHQMDKRTIAEAAINEAYKKMPEDEAVLALKKAIEGTGSP